MSSYPLKILKWIVILSLLNFPAQLTAGKYAADFLRIGVGARALGVGGAFVGIADDGTASYWNPAGLANLSRHQILFSHVQMFDNLANHNFANLSLKLSSNLGLGISWIRLSVDDIPRYSTLQGTRYNRILNPHLRSTGIAEGFFGDTEDALLLSFGKGFDFDLSIGGGLLPTIIPTRLSIGISYKYISQKLDTAEGKGQGLDMGILLNFIGPTAKGGMPRRILTFGVNFQDMAQTTIAWNTANHTRDQLPFKLLLGLSYSEWLPWLVSQITLSMERDNSYGASNHWGAELTFRKIITLRAGINNRDFTAGAGLKIFWLRIDYAFVSYDLGNSHRISGGVEF